MPSSIGSLSCGKSRRYSSKGTATLSDAFHRARSSCCAIAMSPLAPCNCPLSAVRGRSRRGLRCGVPCSSSRPTPWWAVSCSVAGRSGPRVSGSGAVVVDFLRRAGHHESLVMDRVFCS